MRLRVPVTLYLEVDNKNEKRAISDAMAWVQQVFEAGASSVEARRIRQCEVSIREKLTHEIEPHIGPDNDE